MRIGIMTLCEGNNYGGVLQAYALQTYLRQMGHESSILRVNCGDRKGSPFKALERPVKAVVEMIKGRAFASFRNTHFISENGVPCRLQEFLAEPPRFDAYVCGSDQVWSPGACSDSALRKLFFLDFGAAAAKRISYAASWGAKSVDASLRESVAACLKRFDAISVREKNGVDIVAGLGFPSAWLPDPTFLLEAGHWARMSEDARCPQKDSVLFQCEYRWTPCVPFSKVRTVLIRKHGWKTVIPFSDHPLRDAARTRCLTPTEWLGQMKRSSFVLTNSFHGMVFSIIFQRPFICIPLEGKYAGMNERIFSLAERLGLSDRLLFSFDEPRILALAEKPIRWEEVSQKVQAWRQEAHTFLDRALCGGGRTPSP